ncbi:MAG: ATP-binding cassette domain-containing protein [Bacillota bacterium]|nr:ATP-binding cassette domain-containing protein [Bacillota bacterium]
MIQLTGLTKTYGDKTAVNDISFQIHPGVVTGFLGPNGAGKSTTIRMILNLAIPTAGSVTVDGTSFASLEKPLEKIGAMVDTNTIDSRLTPEQYLRILATAAGLDRGRPGEVLSLVGLKAVAEKRIGTFSLGMRQRVGLAAALIGDPETIILDEPFNGLDVDGIHWLRDLLRDLAKQGKAILVSSHLLSEVQALADRIIMLAQGELIADMSMEELLEASLSSYVQVQTDDVAKLYEILTAEGAQVDVMQDEKLRVRKTSQKRIGDIAFGHGLVIYELLTHHPSLEELFSELVAGKSEYRGSNSHTNKAKVAS